MTNAKAIWAFCAALLSLAVFGGVAVVEYGEREIRLEHVVVAVPIALVLALLALALGRQARRDHQRTLGRSGSRGFVALARFLATLAFLLALTAALALGAFAVLVLALD